MNGQQLIAYLEKEWGLSVTPRQIRRWVANATIPYVRLNQKRVQFPHRLIVPWIQRKTKGVK